MPYIHTPLLSDVLPSAPAKQKGRERKEKKRKETCNIHFFFFGFNETVDHSFDLI